jgi:hypothetical protein
VEELMGTNLLLKVLGDERQKGIEQGVQQGIEQGILRTLRRRFGDMPDELAGQVVRVSDADRLVSLLDAAVDARSLDDFTGALAR